ncbi:MAG: site-specific integrase [Gammaproteobacteria bacterium]|nr:site-specific integrase [Gammaproteobacteria bacterium]
MSEMDLTVLPQLGSLTQAYYPELLNGSEGSNRAPLKTCQIKCDNDLAAIHAWLNEYQTTPSTYRIYQKEAERLLLWCLYQHQKPLSSLDRDDFEAYVNFLSNPQPYSRWCGKKGGKGKLRGSADWRPFFGALTPKSIHHALTILTSLMSYLVEVGYLLQNPLKLMRRVKKQVSHFEERKLDVQARILEPDEWQVFIQTLENLPETTQKEKAERERLRLIVYMLFYLGLRVNELTTHTWSAFRQIEGLWWFVVKGKGGKVAKVPVHDKLWKLILRCRMSEGMPPVPAADEHTPIITSLENNKALGNRQINNLLKILGVAASQQFGDNPMEGNKLKKVSAHWLRHQSATMQSRAGISELHIQENLRHGNSDTTRLYIHQYDTERHIEIQKI